MKRLSIYSERAVQADEIRRSLAGHFETRFLGLEHLGDFEPEEFTVVDVTLRQGAHLVDIKQWLMRKPKDGKVIVAVEKASRIDVAQAYAIGATDIVDRPLNGRELRKRLRPWLGAAAAPSNFVALAGNASMFPAHDVPGVAAAVDTLQGLFSSACLAESLNAAAVDVASEAIVGQIDEKGLASWIDTVRNHHSQTYQHCLLVTGVAAAFGQYIGLSKKDRQRLSIAGMLHDIGKAHIPLQILEKPGPLDKAEMAVMRKHPELGVETLGPQSGLAPEMIDMVLHHHEYLDGSGYPHGLQAGEIGDLVRIMTISDVFGALIERRSYKPPLSSAAAYQILLDMGPKLDKDLIREFGPVAQLDQHQ